SRSRSRSWSSRGGLISWHDPKVRLSGLMSFTQILIPIDKCPDLQFDGPKAGAPEILIDLLEIKVPDYH
ncbi:MAG: hypothetical protein ACRDL7_09900, partial [Gaiellaceae bacterium]